MGLFKDGFTQLKRASEPLYKSPKSVQQTIEIKAISKSGIFEVSRNKYSKCYRFEDMNYTMATEDEQIGIFSRYCQLLNSLDCDFKITVNNKNKDMDSFYKNVLIADEGDSYDAYRTAYNEIVLEKLNGFSQGIDQERYLTLTVERKNFEEAKQAFISLENTLGKAFSELGTKFTALNANERLKILHDFYHLGYERNFRFDIAEAKRVPRDFRNDLCNGMLRYHQDYIEDEHKFSRVLFIKKYPSSLSDRFINEITSLPMQTITSIDVVPVPKDITTSILHKKYLGIESDIIKQQRIRNNNNDFSSDISYLKRVEKREIEGIMDDVRENDQSLFFVGVDIVVTADSKEELERRCEAIESIGKRNSCVIDVHYLKQREALNSALPIGVRQVETMRTLLTQSLATLMPFNVQELYDENGIYYGINQISQKLILADRTTLINPNGFIFGVPGSGKSFFTKMEIGNVYLSTKDDIIIISPTMEYKAIAEKYGGVHYNLSAYSQQYCNPLDVDVGNLDVNDTKGIIRSKCEFMLGLCEKCMAGEMNPRQKSIIDRCVSEMYMAIAKSEEKKVPVMGDFYELLLDQPEPEAREVALALELFVKGSLNIFNHQTNIDQNNRFSVYCIRDLGADLSSIAMMVVLETVHKRIIANGEKGITTRLYIDEFHVLLESDYCAKYIYQLWKVVRKEKGICTGITQNVIDMLQNYVGLTLLANSEFIALLKQAVTDSAKITESIGISQELLRYVTNSKSGMGIIKYGADIIPFDGQIDKESILYDLYNTNPYETMYAV